MREDMDKQIVERPRRWSRVGGIYRRRNRYRAKRVDMEAAPKQVSMGAERQYGHRDKQLRERLNPLERFLASNVGRPWANVYSEIREQLNINTAVQYHVVQHLRWMVHNDVVMSEDGHPMRPAGHHSVRHAYAEIYSRRRSPTFYIHPINGLLCKAPRAEPEDEEDGTLYSIPRTDIIATLVDGESFLKVDGVWYRPMFQTLPEDGPSWNKPMVHKVMDVEHFDYGPEDIIFGKVGRVSEFGAAHALRAYGSSDVYCVGKKQLNSRELKRLGLVND